VAFLHRHSQGFCIAILKVMQKVGVRMVMQTVGDNVSALKVDSR
jgi:hypothetical protein